MSGLEIMPDQWVTGRTRASAAASWLQAHGRDTVALPVLDLLTVVARLEQCARDPDADPVALGRLFTCDLPRLRQYLPDEALEELGR